MQQFTESDLLFSFPDDWVVRSFDATRAYQSVSGYGLKGVDFIAISPDERLWLIEVKNFRPRFKGGREYRAKRKKPEVLAKLLAKKYKDSVRLIRVVQKSFTRSLFGRLRIWYRSKVQASRASDYWFWSTAYLLCTGDRAPVEFVLWMETPESNNDYDVEVYEQLRQHGPGGGTFTVAERAHPQALPFRAE